MKREYKDLFLKISDDDYELPLAVADTQAELSRMTHADTGQICRELKKQKENIWSRFIAVPKESDPILPSRSTRKKMGLTVVGNGVIYDSISAAARMHKVSPSTIDYWIKIDPDWYISENSPKPFLDNDYSNEYNQKGDKMTLEEFMESYNGNVKIGTVKGASFIYCGPANKVDLNVLNDIITLKTTKLLKNADRTLRAHQAIGTGYDAYTEIMEKRKGISKKAIPTYEQWKMQMEEESRKKQAYVNKLEDRIMAFPHIRTRTIVKLFDSILEPDTKIVLVEGKEVGTYWLTSECTGVFYGKY